jgi:hypothetical protein
MEMPASAKTISSEVPYRGAFFDFELNYFSFKRDRMGVTCCGGV